MGLSLLEALALLRERHFIIFPSSWLIFLLLGRALIRSRQGRTGRGMESLGSSIFLITFITACSLIQLVTLELSGSEPVQEDIDLSVGLLGNIKFFISLTYLHPQLRQMAWDISLYLLCVMLNVVIPCMCALTISKRRHRTSIAREAAFILFVLLAYQTALWSLGLILPLNNTKIGYHPTSDTSWFSFIFFRTLQQSVAYLAAIGTVVSAIINGFASVNFPLEQMMITVGVDEMLLKEREQALRNLLEGVIERKKKLAMEAFLVTRDEDNYHVVDYDAPPSQSENRLNKTRISSRLSSNDRFNTMSSSIHSLSSGGLSGGTNFHLSSCLEDNSKDKKHYLVTFLQNILSDFFDPEGLKRSSSRGMSTGAINNGSGVPLSSLSSRCQSLHKEVVFMEKIMEDHFFETSYLRELYEQRLYSKTNIGRALYSFGYMLSIFACLRFLAGLLSVIQYMVRFLAGTSITGTDEAYDSVVSRILRFLVNTLGLPIDLSLWSPLLSFFLISSLALMQIRGFMASSRYVASWLSAIPADMHALLLAFVAGCYFMACVVLLRVHLPGRYRIGVTVVLGIERDFGCYVWLYEIVFVFGTIFAAANLWNEKKRKNMALAPMINKSRNGSRFNDRDY